VKKKNQQNNTLQNALTGTVVKSTGSWYDVKNQNDDVITCRIRGKFRIKGIKTTNPVAVGDKVDYIMEKDKNTGVIVNIHPRKNYLLRRSINLSKQYHILAANIDRVFVTASIINPETTTVFTDRILITAEAYNIPAVILINKTDLLTGEKLINRKNQFKNIYESAGYPVLEVSAKTGKNITALKELMHNRTSMFTGHSGVGKSSLINAVDPYLQLKTAEISETHRQGKHTTTFAQMYDLHFGGHIIDTPGIRGFGIVDMKASEIDHYFPEIFSYKSECKFNDCKHINEPGCAVKPAVESGKIPLSRYKSYLQILSETEGNNQTYR
jgi:ribosome biogenesis GTPase